QRGEWSTDRLGFGQDPRQGRLEVSPDVLVQCFQRRNVQDANALRLPRCSPEVVERRQERGQCLSRPGRRNDQGMLGPCNDRPAETLWWSRPPELLPEPRGHCRMEQVQHVVRAIAATLHKCDGLSPRTPSSRSKSPSIFTHGAIFRKGFSVQKFTGFWKDG